MTDGSFPIPGEVEDVAALRALEEAHADLAAAGRRLVDAIVRTRAEPGVAHAVAAELDDLTGRLLADAHDGPLGLQPSSDGVLRDVANPAAGLRNPIAPPLVVVKDRQACTAQTSADLGPAYEGPPGCVHGGIIALVLDQVCGTVPPLAGMPSMTASLDLTYKRPTPLGRVGARAWIERRDGWKTTVRAELTDAAGRVTVEAQGLFVVPRAFRDHLDAAWDPADLHPADVPPSDVGQHPV